MTPLRSYAGVPLSDDSGHILGAHCVIDVTAGTFTERDITVLTDGAHQSMHILTDYRLNP